MAELKRRPCCDFCGQPVALCAGCLRGRIGGFPPVICGDCVLTAAAEMCAAGLVELSAGRLPAPQMAQQEVRG